MDYLVNVKSPGYSMTRQFSVDIEADGLTTVARMS